MTIQLTRRTVALAIVAFLAVAAVATTSLVLTLTGRAEANHRFNDIANNSFFHDSTAWLKDNGIARGFNDGRFRPNSNITRGQAAFWFGNYNDAIEWIEEEQPSYQTTGHQAQVDCPAGKRPLGGGGAATGGFVMEDSQPIFVGPPNPRTGWRVTWVHKDSGGSSGFGGIIWVACAPNPIP